MTEQRTAPEALLRGNGFSPNKNKPGVWYCRLNDGRYLNADFRDWASGTRPAPNFYIGKREGGVEDATEHPLAKSVKSAMFGKAATPAEEKTASKKDEPEVAEKPPEWSIIVRRCIGGVWRTFPFTASEVEAQKVACIKANVAAAQQVLASVDAIPKDKDGKPAPERMYVEWSKMSIVEKTLDHWFHYFERWADLEIYAGRRKSLEEKK